MRPDRRFDSRKMPAIMKRALAKTLMLYFLVGIGVIAAAHRAQGKTPSEDELGAAMAPVPIHPRVKAVAPWLKNDDWSIRSIAALELRSRSDVGTIRMLTRMLRSEKHPKVIACALKSMLGRSRIELVGEGGPVLVEALLHFITHAHPTVASRAMTVLQKLPRMKLGSEPTAYREWWPLGKKRFLKEHRTLAAALAPPAKKSDGAKDVSSVAAAPDNHLYESLERMRRHGLEVCIVMDHTGSMTSVIGATKRQAKSVISKLRRYIPGFRAGLVTYDDRAMARCTLTSNGKLLLRAFNKVAAAGGGDWEEGVDKGIALALKQTVTGWSRRALRMIVVMGDAPPHGSDVPVLGRIIRRARASVDYDVPIQIHTVSAGSNEVHHFPQIARAGGGLHVPLSRANNLVELFVRMAMGGAKHETILRWMKEMDALDDTERKRTKKKRR